MEPLDEDHFGTLEAFGWPTTADEAEAVLAAFLADILPSFGTWQDAMASGQPWMANRPDSAETYTRTESTARATGSGRGRAGAATRKATHAAATAKSAGRRGKREEVSSRAMEESGCGSGMPGFAASMIPDRGSA